MGADREKRLEAAEQAKKRQRERQLRLAYEDLDIKSKALEQKQEEAIIDMQILQQTNEALIESNRKVTDTLLEEIAGRKKRKPTYTNELRMKKLWEKYGDDE